MELNDPALFRQQGYIGGAWVDAEDGATFEVTDPADGAPLGTVPKMGAAETRRAIDAANAACRRPAVRGKLSLGNRRRLNQSGRPLTTD